jgi:hypothetical protein
MSSDGTGIRRLTATKNFETGADWGPG